MPISVLKKKLCSIASHFVREGTRTSTSLDEGRIGYVSTNDNVADRLTKPIINGEKRTKFVNMILHQIKLGMENTGDIWNSN